MKRIVLGIDYGDHYVGLAIGTGTLAVPLQVVEHTPDLESQIASIVTERSITHIVIGMPTSMSGSKNERTQETDRFIERLSAYVHIPIIPFDERLSTSEAVRQNTRRDRHDAHAAALIAQAYLDANPSPDQI